MKYTAGLILRVALAFFLGIFYKLYYIIFKPLTLYLSFIFLKMFDNTAILFNDSIMASMHELTFVDACTAAAAYLLLTLLILLTKDLKPIERVGMFIYGSLLILGFNILRIELLFLMLYKLDYSIFYSVHMIIWKFLSTIYVFLVWIFLTWIYKVKSIPAYSDMKYLWGIAKRGNFKKSKKARRRSPK